MGGKLKPTAGTKIIGTEYKKKVELITNRLLHSFDFFDADNVGQRGRNVTAAGQPERSAAATHAAIREEAI